MWSALAQVLGGAQCWEVKVLTDGRGRGKNGYEKPYTEAWEVSLSQHHHGLGGPEVRRVCVFEHACMQFCV